MSEQKSIKEQIMHLRVQEVELLLSIIGDLGFIGYKVSLCKLKGYSLQQCANKFGITKRHAQVIFEKCTKKRYDNALKELFGIK